MTGDHYREYVAADGHRESDDSDDDGNDVWFSDPSQMLLSVGGEAPATSLYCQHQFCRKEEIPDALHIGSMSPQKVQNKLFWTHSFQQQQKALVLSGKQKRSTNVNFRMRVEICFCIWNNSA